ncbi:hypothetical protein F8568_036385 [Actinomadura sp. LD22]|uniref:Uncharacterized protein n=1 Tax=Actinomadura physcomitrii TaxID=2650748 RepID=A0A6I4MJB8_9ACTN|nr:hypothetical protein [Actinomadura physcomitrii]MWA05743.1 hypothetical protein [Actinomadura physcomitrii]
MLGGSVHIGDIYLYTIAPVVIFLAIAGWVLLTFHASKERERPAGRDPQMPNRGDVTGGILRGSPSQRNRRDPALTPAERELARLEAERAEAARREAAARDAAERERAANARAAAARRRFGPLRWIHKRHAGTIRQIK